MKKSCLKIMFIVLVLFMIYSLSCTSQNDTGDSRFIVYGTMRCGYTVKMLDYLKKHNQSVKFVDVSTTQGDTDFKMVTNGKNIRGVPYTIDNKTGKSIEGFREIIL